MDIWLKDDKNFEMGKVCLGLVANAKEINKVMFEAENNLYMDHILKEASKFFNEKNDYIGLDMQVHAIKKSNSGFATKKSLPITETLPIL